MRLGGLVKFSLVDFPGKMAAVIFTQGCNFRCPFCHNPDLVLPEKFKPPLSKESVMQFLEKRRNVLQGVVVTGGEPTIQKDLLDFLGQIKALGFAVKLDTNGSNPDVLEKVVNSRVVDYIAMDIKAPLYKYCLLAGVSCDTDKIHKSIEIIIQSNIQHEFRTTLVKPLLSSQDIPLLSAWGRQSKRYILQPFVAGEKILDPDLSSREQYTQKEVDEFQKEWGISEPHHPAAALIADQ